MQPNHIILLVQESNVSLVYIIIVNIFKEPRLPRW